MIINGKKLAQEILADLKKKFKKFKKVTLAAIMVGDNPASFSFLKQKQKIAQKLGVELKIFKLSASFSNKKVITEIKKIAGKKQIKGIIVQLPLPEKFNSAKILETLPAQKDVDALGNKAVVLAPSVEVIKFVFKKYKINYRNKKIVINGLGNLIGQPIYNWLKIVACDVLAIEKTAAIKKRKRLIQEADILISGAGKANMVPTKWIKKGTIIIDFGYDFIKGKIYGDVEKKASSKAKIFTPTPGGTGPILVAMVFKNLLNLLKN